jgi:SNARE protein
MVGQLNKLVQQKKKRGDELQNKAELLAAAAASGAAGGKKGKGGKGGGGAPGEGGGMEMTASGAVGGGTDITSQMSTQQLMNTGRKTMTETEKSILRSARVVEDTIAIGQQTAAMLGEQTHQMEKIMNDLDEITFSMKKAQKLIRDITRSMATDKCILMFLMLIVGGIVAIVVLKVAKVKLVKGINISVPLGLKSPPPPAPPPSPMPPPAAARRLLAGGGWEGRIAGAEGAAWRQAGGGGEADGAAWQRALEEAMHAGAEAAR